MGQCDEFQQINVDNSLIGSNSSCANGEALEEFYVMVQKESKFHRNSIDRRGNWRPKQVRPDLNSNEGTESADLIHATLWWDTDFFDPVVRAEAWSGLLWPQAGSQWRLEQLMNTSKGYNIDMDWYQFARCHIMTSDLFHVMWRLQQGAGTDGILGHDVVWDHRNYKKQQWYHNDCNTSHDTQQRPY